MPELKEPKLFDQEALEEDDQPTQPDKFTKRVARRRKIAGYASSGALLGSIVGGGYLGFKTMDGLVSSNHHDHAAAIARYQNCERVVILNDANHDGVARINFKDNNSPQLTACGFKGLWNFLADKVEHRQNMLDSWVPYLDISGTVQLPSQAALDNAVTQEKQDSHEYAVERRSEGVMAGGFVGLVGFFGVAFVGSMTRRGWRQFGEEISLETAESESVEFELVPMNEEFRRGLTQE